MDIKDLEIYELKARLSYAQYLMDAVVKADADALRGINIDIFNAAIDAMAVYRGEMNEL